jgi:hypothetical protein
LKKIQSFARRKLGLSGEVEFRRVSQGNRFVFATTTNPEATKHTISYSDLSSLDEVDFYHEMCRAKVYELGFGSAEAAALNAMRDCGKEDPKYIVDANAATVVAGEVYANQLLFLRFREESRRRIEKLVESFESTDALTGLNTRMGFWGIAGISYFKVACERSGNPFPVKLVKDAMSRSPFASQITQSFESANSILAELPQLRDGAPFDDLEKISIADAITRLFSAKTGLDCGKE